MTCVPSRLRRRVGKIACELEQAYATHQWRFCPRKAERVGTAREILHVRSICRGAPLPILQVYSNGNVLWTHLPFGGVGMGSAVVALIFSMAKREVTFRNGTTAIRRL